MFYFVDHGPGWSRNPSGLMTLERKFQRRCWADRLGVRWIIVKWQHWTEDEWSAQFGTRKQANPSKDPAAAGTATDEPSWTATVPYPRHGEWLPIENWKLEEDEEPTPDLTQKFIWALKRDREMTIEKWVEQDEWQHKDNRRLWKSEWRSRIDDAMTAFGRIPGSHGGQTEFQSGSRMAELPAEESTKEVIA